MTGGRAEGGFKRSSLQIRQSDHRRCFAFQGRLPYPNVRPQASRSSRTAFQELAGKTEQLATRETHHKAASGIARQSRQRGREARAAALNQITTRKVRTIYPCDFPLPYNPSPPGTGSVTSEGFPRNHQDFRRKLWISS